MRKKAQVTIFIIIAAVIALSVIIFFVVQNQINQEQIPPELSPVFNQYLNCIEFEVKSAIQLAGSQGGYVEVTEYIPGSEYAPFSSHLNFLGFPAPYWYYISANGLIKEQVPTKSEIEKQIATFVEEGLSLCSFDSFYQQGFEIEITQPTAEVTIEQNNVKVSVI